MAAINLKFSTLQPEAATQSFVVEAGDPFVLEIRRHETVRIVDLKGNQAVDTIFYNAHDYTDRYSAQDTIREQRSLYLTTGTKLLSTNGHVLLTIVADTCGRHDTLGGACATESNRVRYDLAKGHMHACRNSFLKGLEEWNRRVKDGGAQSQRTRDSSTDTRLMNKRDITSNINFFMNVPVTPEGRLTFEDGVSEAGKYVEMWAEMDVLMVISNCPQLNNPCNGFDPTPVQILLWDTHVS